MKLVIYCLVFLSIASTMALASIYLISNDIDPVNEPESSDPDINEMLKRILEQRTEDREPGVHVYSDLYSCAIKAVVSFVGCMHLDHLQEQTDPLPFLKCFNEAINAFVKCIFLTPSSRTLPDARWTNIPKA